MTPFRSREQEKAAFAKKSQAPAGDGTHRVPLFSRTPAAQHDLVFEGAVSRLATDFVDYLPETINTLGIVSLDAWGEIVPDSLTALERDGNLPSGVDARAYHAQHEKALREAVVKELRQRGIQVVERRQDTLRILASTKRLEERHLGGFAHEIANHNASPEEARDAALHSRETYTVLGDGTVVPGHKQPGRILIVRP